MFTTHAAPRFLARATLAVTIAATTLPAAATPKQVNADDVVRSVSTAGLDLTSATDRAVLRHRIDVAALKVCKEVEGTDGLEDPGFRECFMRATNVAWTQMEVMVADARTRSMVASGAAK